MEPAGEGSETLTTRGRARLRGSRFLASAASPRGNHRTSAVTSNGQWRVLRNTTRRKKSRHGERCTKGAGRPETVCVVVAPKAWCMSPGPKANISPTHPTDWPCDQREGCFFSFAISRYTSKENGPPGAQPSAQRWRQTDNGRGGFLGPHCVCCFHQGRNCVGPADGVLRPYRPGCYRGLLK